MATILALDLPKAEVADVLAAILCAKASLQRALLVTRCRIDDAAALLETMPCVAESAHDPSPLPSKLEALMNLVEARRHQGREADVRALVETIQALSAPVAELALDDATRRTRKLQQQQHALAHHAVDEAR